MSGKIEVSASILSANLAELGKDVAMLSEIGCDSVHIDVMDGVYVPNLTFGVGLIQAIRAYSALPFHVHLMVVKPQDYIDSLIKIGVQSISFHAEVTAHPHRLVQQIQDNGVRAGLVLNPGFSFEPFTPLLESVDLVTIMTVNPGFGGQSFIASQIAIIQALHAWRPKLPICVDGGINLQTGPRCTLSGATMLVVGHALFSAPDHADFVMHLGKECAKK